jgi:hypothetical protein
MNDHTSVRTRLLIRPELVENESLRGYVSRLSSCNGSSPLLKPMLASLQATTGAIQEIATLTDCSASLLSEHGSLMQGRNAGNSGVLFGNSILSTDQVWMHRRTVCPRCLSRNGVSICCWELRDYDVCHEHGCYLVDRCSGCDRVLSWANTSSEVCSCGVRLADIKIPMASTNRRLICELIADAKSASRFDQREIVSDSLTPLNWLFMVSNFVLSILIPGFFQEHMGKRHAISGQTSEELLLVILKDSEYCDHLRQLMLLHDFRNQMKMTRALRAGIFNQELRKTFLPCLKKVTIHSHLFKIKAEMQKEKELKLQATQRFAILAQKKRMESHSFQLQTAAF